MLVLVPKKKPKRTWAIHLPNQESEVEVQAKHWGSQFFKHLNYVTILGTWNSYRLNPYSFCQRCVFIKELAQETSRYSLSKKHAITVAVFNGKNILMWALTQLVKIVLASTPSCYNRRSFLPPDSGEKLWDQTQIVTHFCDATLTSKWHFFRHSGVKIR